MSRKAFFWFEFAILVGGNVVIFLGEQPYGIILGAALVGLGCLMLCLTLIRSRNIAHQAPDRQEPDASDRPTN
jgi:hypothetical protein